MRHNNSKTIRSFDTTTVCPRQARGEGCPYCYVAAARRAGCRAKARVAHIPYDGWVGRLWPATVERLRRCGGIRMFAFGDYVPAHRGDVRRFLGDCAIRGLPAKAVTKETLFVRHFHDECADVLSAVHVSIDGLGGAGSRIGHAAARRLRDRYRRVLVRAVCLTMADVDRFGALDWVDVLTLNHGPNGFHRFTAGERLAIRGRYGDRLCCAGGVCAACSVRCRADQGVCASQSAADSSREG
jgi:hypothetical protein